jgi:hypothetical protein
VDQSIVAPHSPPWAGAGIYSFASSAVSVDVRIELVRDGSSVSGHPEVAPSCSDPIRRVSCVVGRTSRSWRPLRRDVTHDCTCLSWQSQQIMLLSSDFVVCFSAATRRRLKLSCFLASAPVTTYIAQCRCRRRWSQPLRQAPVGAAACERKADDAVGRAFRLRRYAS